MIDHQYRCIFIHQRKCAGVSISRAFNFKNFDDKDGSFHIYNDGVQSKNWTDRPADYFIFSVVRNPFDRLISGWKHIEETKHLPLEQVVENWPQQRPAWGHITRPQIDMLRSKETGQLVTHDLIRFETLQSDFDRICNKIGKPRFDLPHANASIRERDYRRYFTPHTRRLTEKQFSEDLEAFNYDF